MSITDRPGFRIPDNLCPELRKALFRLSRRDDLSERAAEFISNAALWPDPIEFLSQSAAGLRVIDHLARNERVIESFSISSPRHQ